MRKKVTEIKRTLAFEPVFFKSWDELKSVWLLCFDLQKANTVMAVKVVELALFHFLGAEMLHLAFSWRESFFVHLSLCTNDKGSPKTSILKAPLRQISLS